MAEPVALPADYGPLLAEIKARVQVARIKAGLAANRELLALYWDIGRLILQAQERQGYGKKVVERLAADLQRVFPGVGGFSPLNVWRMRAFYAAHAAATTNLSQPVTESTEASNLSLAVTDSGDKALPSLIPEPFASLPWSHNLLLLHKLDTPADRLWYASKTLEFGWSRNVLALQIESQLHARQGNAVSNFAATLPPAPSDLAQGITKDPYLFDFDLLFYHLTLRCFVVIDLKAGEFTPEAAGKMNFYLSAVDERFKQPGDQPSIGLILCRSKDRVIAEYALRDLNKPIGVSDYVTRLVDSLPEALEGSVPSVVELEQALSDDQP